MTNAANELGPIAETYDELQGLPHIRKAWGGMGLPEDAGIRYLCSMLQSIELIALNEIDLCQRLERSILEENWNDAGEQATWLSALSTIAVNIAKGCDAVGVENCSLHLTSPLRSLAMGSLMKQIDALERSALPVFDRHSQEFEDGVRTGGHSSSFATIVHRLKIFFRNVQTASEILQHVRLPSSVESYSSAIVSAALESAVRVLSIRGETYFTQFRLLHQIPELVGLDGLAACDRLQASGAGNFRELIRDIAMLQEISELALLCLSPLVTNLFPASYYKIRNNLGITSGSHSVTLSKQLFSRKFVELSEHFLLLAQRFATSDRGEEAENFRLVLSFWRHYRANVYAWRQAHIHLPRNVLGGPGTKSLIGSPDAVSAVEALRRNIARNDPFDRLSSHAEPLDLLTCGYGLDRWLLNLTGDVAQSEFPEVQKREGRFGRPDGSK
jgi:hypothetical protein